MTEHRRASLAEMLAINNIVRRRRIPGVVGNTDIASDRGLIALSMHIKASHPDANFERQMYDHLAAIGREEITIPPATGATAALEVGLPVLEFIQNVPDHS